MPSPQYDGRGSAHEGISYESPRDILEEREARVERVSDDADQRAELAFAMGRILAWILRARTLSQVGFRATIVAYNIRPDLIGGKSLEEIAHMMGYGRSAAHNQSKDFQRTFGVQHINRHAKSSRP